MQYSRAIARLYLNGKDVGGVNVRGWDGSWGFGEFHPDAAFGAFAGCFSRWALLMHADEDRERISPEALEELRETEREIDALRARLLLTDTNEWRSIRQLNIDGGLIEWKEDSL